MYTTHSCETITIARSRRASRRAFATIQSVLLVAVTATMAFGVRSYFGGSLMTGVSGRVAQLFDGTASTPSPSELAIGGPIIVEAGGSSGGSLPGSDANDGVATDGSGGGPARPLDITTVLANSIVTNTHQQHLDRDSAGIDIDDSTLPEGSRAPVQTPVGGTVTFVGGGYGTVAIRDANGNIHKLLHLSSQSVKVGQIVRPGDEIGRLGNTVPAGRPPVKDHVHYQIQSTGGAFLDPQTFDYGQDE